MAESHKIVRYRYYAFSTREDHRAVASLLLYGDTGYLGGASFYRSDGPPLEPAVKYPSGVYGLNYRLDDLPILIDMLRNEEPVYLIYDGALNSRISTSLEMVGEEDD